MNNNKLSFVDWMVFAQKLWRDLRGNSWTTNSGVGAWSLCMSNMRVDKLVEEKAIESY